MKYRGNLPQLEADVFLADGGIETTLIFHDGLELPLFAAFDLFKTEAGRSALTRYFTTYATLAQEHQVGVVLESATWRANPDWAQALGYSADALKQVNHEAIELLVAIRHQYETDDAPIVISGCLGPRGDGYNPSARMTAAEAEAYHAEQIKAFAASDADLVTAITMNYPEEAIGIVRAAHAIDMPVVISFTVETDGKLPTGHTLQEAIEMVDAATNNAAQYFMLNCAHPTHFDSVLKTDAPWVKRLRGLRANASAKSHAELDESETLEDGDPHELAQQYRDLRTQLNHLTVLGGCCGTDHRHIAAICQAVRMLQ